MNQQVLRSGLRGGAEFLLVLFFVVVGYAAWRKGLFPASANGYLGGYLQAALAAAAGALLVNLVAARSGRPGGAALVLGFLAVLGVAYYCGLSALAAAALLLAVSWGVGSLFHTGSGSDPWLTSLVGLAVVAAVVGWLLPFQVHDGRIHLAAAVLNRPHVSVNFIEAVRRHSRARVVYYGHDVHHLRLLEQLKLQPDPALQAEAERFRAMEHDLWRRSDVILYPSSDETAHVRAWLQAQGGAAVAETVPLFAYEALDEADVPGPEHRRDILFVAGFAHPPNVDAACWFVREALPRIRERMPGVRTLLVGSNPHPDVQALAGDGVEVTGYVSDERLAAYYRAARVAVAPLRFGGGVKGKVLESLRFGVPCVTTSTGMQGLGDAAGFMPRADDADGFAAAVLRLLADDGDWHRVSAASRGFIARHYSREALWGVLSRSVGA
ncbi:glycosyltransferase [Pseudoxanthomonas sp. SGT-18]|uniref:glycosyltransferase n=1 Tax=Pseudoxanthomonas sp. SGT-18 TaxID=2493087 RepID=UPI000F628E59|nr:glycosyltransferase [Pseudoxanthomonas sp. SGT-18]